MLITPTFVAVNNYLSSGLDRMRKLVDQLLHTVDFLLSLSDVLLVHQSVVYRGQRSSAVSCVEETFSN